MTTLDEAVERVQEGLTAGHIGYHGLYSRNQQDYREMWTQLGRWIADQPRENIEMIREKYLAIADDHAPIMAPTGINTTRYE